MAARTAGAPPLAKLSLPPDLYDRLLAGGAMLLLLMVTAALWRGRSEWGEIPPIVWAHLVTIMVALVLTPVMLLRRRGDRLHRRLGWLWCAAMAFTAAASFGIADINQGRFSPIHLLSAFTLLQVPVIAWSARAHKVARHRAAVRAMVAGALIIAGFFTFPPGRLLGGWLFG
jgi:uncharacterized membrane protein